MAKGDVTTVKDKCYTGTEQEQGWGGVIRESIFGDHDRTVRVNDKDHTGEVVDRKKK